VIRTRQFAAVSLTVLLAASSRTLSQDHPTPPAEPEPAEAPPAAAEAAPAEPEPAEAPPPAPVLSDAAVAALQKAKDEFKTGAWTAALEAAKTVLGENPNDLESLYIAGVSERQLNQLAEADAHLKTLIEVEPLFPLAHFQLGYVLFLEAEEKTRDGKVDEAKPLYIGAATAFGQELERSADHIASLSSRAIAYARAGQIDESARAHEAWIAAVPEKNDPVVSLAALYAAVGRATEAMATLDRLPDKTPKATFDATITVASVFTSRRDWSGAVPFLEKAVDLDPTSSSARALLTESCARAGLVNDTARNLETLLTLNPTPEEAEAVGEAIKASIGNGKSAPAVSGVEPPAALRIPAPRYPTGPDRSVETEVLVLTQVRQDNAVVNTILVPNRIWKEIRDTGFEAAAIDAVKRGKFAAGTKDGQPAELWLVVAVKFTK
jgi:tetratricopeptide (TPR) repeat protein